MTTTTPNLGLTLYDSSTDTSVLFSTFRAVWGGTAPTSNFYKIDTAYGVQASQIANLMNTRGAIPVSALFSSANYYVANGVSDITAYTAGMTIILNVDTTSNGTVTLNINSLGIISVMKVDSTGTPINLTGSDLVKGRQYLMVYDGARWLWVSANSADQIQIVGTSGNVVTVGATNNLDGSLTQSSLISNTLHAAIVKTTLNDNDEFGISDSAASNILKKATWANIRATLKTYLDTLYMSLVAPGASGNVMTSNGSAWVSSVPSKLPFNGTYGDGSDGDATISSTVTLTRDMFYNNLTITGSGVLIPAGYIIYVSGNLTIQSGGIIAANGSNGAIGSGGNGGAGGAGAVGTTLHYPIATSGSAGGNSGGVGTVNGTSGTSGVSQNTSTLAPISMRAGGGGGGGGGHGSSPTNGSNSAGSLFGARGGNGGATTSTTNISSAGGGGGGGGGVIDVRAYIIGNAGSIQALGGNGGDAQGGANGGGGGGGGGGCISVIYHSTTGNGIGTLNVNGGAAGASGSASVGANGYTMTTQI
jgi:hypothetical protein